MLFPPIPGCYKSEIPRRRWASTIARKCSTPDVLSTGRKVIITRSRSTDAFSNTLLDVGEVWAYNICMNRRKLRNGIQDYYRLREEGYLYIDKTELLNRLVQEGSVYFLSRPGRFSAILHRAHQQTVKRACVIIDNAPLHEEYKQFLKPFFGVLKSSDAHLKFAFITGVTKFGPDTRSSSTRSVRPDQVSGSASLNRSPTI